MAYNNLDEMRQEYSDFRKLSGLETFGIRMHYLRRDEATLNLQDEIGYSFDSTIYNLSNPWKANNMFEFPLHLMDSKLFRPNGQLKTIAYAEAQNVTKEVIEKAEQNNFPYFTINFHDRYYCDAFSERRDWYQWIIQYLQERNIEFISFQSALEQLDSVSS